MIKAITPRCCRGRSKPCCPNGRSLCHDWDRCPPLVPVHPTASSTLMNYSDYVIRCCIAPWPGTHVMAVLPPAVHCWLAVALMEEDGDCVAPSTDDAEWAGALILTPAFRLGPRVNELPGKPIRMVRGQMITMPGALAPLPGFSPAKSIRGGLFCNLFQVFMTMNLDRHMIAQKDFYQNLVKNMGRFRPERHR